MLLTVLLIPPLLARIDAEENLLHSQFGDDYNAYRSHTWRLIPGSTSRFARTSSRAFERLRPMRNAAETGLLEIREVALVECSPAPETPSAEKPLTTGDEHEKIIVTLGCVLIALLAFAQPSSTDKKQGTTTTEPIEVTGTIIRTMIAEGAAASYQPRKTLVVREDSSNNPGPLCSQRTWSRCEQGREIVQTAIKPGTRVRVYYADMGDLRMIDHVVVID